MTWGKPRLTELKTDPAHPDEIKVYLSVFQCLGTWSPDVKFLISYEQDKKIPVLTVLPLPFNLEESHQVTRLLVTLKITETRRHREHTHLHRRASLHSGPQVKRSHRLLCTLLCGLPLADSLPPWWGKQLIPEETASGQLFRLPHTSADCRQRLSWRLSSLLHGPFATCPRTWSPLFQHICHDRPWA